MAGVACHTALTSTPSGGGSGGTLDDSDISEDDVDGPSLPAIMPDCPYNHIPPIKVGYCTKQGAVVSI